jgi:hypothetical protein
MVRCVNFTLGKPPAPAKSEGVPRFLAEVVAEKFSGPRVGEPLDSPRPDVVH